jgi:hypothetical protein
VEQLGHCVRGDAGLGPQDLGGLGGLGCRRDREHGPVVAAEVVGGAAQHGGLAGAGRPDDEDEPVLAGHGGGCVCLENVEAVAVERARRPGRRLVRLHGEQQDALLLGDDVLVGEVRLGGGEPDGPTVGGARRAGGGRVEGDAALDGAVAGVLDCLGPVVS